MPPEERDRPQRERALRWIVILTAGALAAVLLAFYYATQPVVILHVDAPVSGVETVHFEMEEIPVVPDAGGVDLNTASAEVLEALPEIGPELAGRIVAYREAHGGFQSVEELLEVEGVGEKTLEALREYLVVS